MQRLTTNTARKYIEKNLNAKYPQMRFNTNRITIEHNRVFLGAIAILIDGKPYGLRDSFSELSHVVGLVGGVKLELTTKEHVHKTQIKVQSLYDELSGKDEGSNFWHKK